MAQFLKFSPEDRGGRILLVSVLFYKDGFFNPDSTACENLMNSFPFLLHSIKNAYVSVLILQGTAVELCIRSDKCCMHNSN